MVELELSSVTHDWIDGGKKELGELVWEPNWSVVVLADPGSLRSSC
jgi:hypothetical protein